MKKICPECKLEKNIESFYKCAGTKDGRHEVCIKCRRELQFLNSEPIESHSRNKCIERYNKNTFEYRKNIFLITNYGITLKEYNHLLVTQNFKCKICEIDQSKLKKALAVDHCHETKKIRGLICIECNHGLGFFRDSINFLENAVSYLEDNE